MMTHKYKMNLIVEHPIITHLLIFVQSYILSILIQSLHLSGPCPLKDTSCIEEDEGNLITVLSTTGDSDCACKCWWYSESFLLKHCFDIISDQCQQRAECSDWTFLEHAPTQTFDCSLLRSCHLQQNLTYYPTLMTSGSDSCLPETFKRRKCLPGTILFSYDFLQYAELTAFDIWYYKFPHHSFTKCVTKF